MNSRHLVDPELAPLLDAWPAFELSAATLPAIRARDLPRPPLPEVDVEEERVEAPGLGDAPPVPLCVYRAKLAGPVPCIYHVHGGGFVIGKAGDLRDVHRVMAEALSCAIVSVDYRLAPETIFPGAIEDCYAGLRWLADEAGKRGIDAGRIGVMGESAGGGLAAALALMARDRGEIALAFQHLIFPMLGDRTCTREDAHPNVGEFIWNADSNRFGWGAILGQPPGGAEVSPYAAAARAADLSGLPPTFIATGALDLFLEEDIDYARRLSRADVPIELHVYPGAFHGFTMMQGARVAAAAQRDSMAALQRALHG